MKLIKFRVTNFRSVDDSGWIEADNVTALIGTNESGKTNILLPLWKLNPAKEGTIVPTADYPRKHYNTIRHQTPKPVFIRAIFELEDDLSLKLSSIVGLPKESLSTVEVAKRFDSEFEIDFPDANPPRSLNSADILSVLEAGQRDVDAMTAIDAELDLKKKMLSAIESARIEIADRKSDLDGPAVGSIVQNLDREDTEEPPETSTIVPRYRQLVESLEKLHKDITKPHPRDVNAAVDLIVSNLPKFVYYSTYGNLDSEIYLPHVISNLKRSDLGLKEQAKARTLKVLFEFVKLQPEEISELGHDFNLQNRRPTEDEITAISEKKKQRSILLQSASTLLTTEFRAWWRQGTYRFRFEADGDHFRIWVSDDKRPEEIELEGRSTGLQWFLSFYLVFLVESRDAHEHAILLLDEPGLSLHPLAQRDLSSFFEGLAKVNQLIYTCHSPFLVDADRLDRVRKVYVGDDGTSKVTDDLRASSTDKEQKGSAYAVHAALGLSVSESLLIGCLPVIVEGPSDQHYLTAIKNLLIASGNLKLGREIVFPPAGGAKGVKAVASILGGRDDELPVAIFDSDSAGLATANSLKKGLYVGAPDRVLEFATFTGMVGSEVEDLIPPSIITKQLDRWLRNDSVPFADEYKAGTPIVPQIEFWATKHGIKLEVPSWKVELARRVKHQLLMGGHQQIDLGIIDQWVRMFEAF